MKKTIIDTTNDKRTEMLVTDLDAFYSEPTPTYLKAGKHTVKLSNWELVPQREVVTRTECYVTKPYVLLDLVDVKSGEATVTRLYSGFVPYFLDQVAAQTDGAISGMKLSEVLAYLGKHKFEIWVTYDKARGPQVSYQEPR